MLYSTGQCSIDKKRNGKQEVHAIKIGYNCSCLSLTWLDFGTSQDLNLQTRGTLAKSRVLVLHKVDCFSWREVRIERIRN